MEKKEPEKNVEPREYHQNVHFWLRKISYFIYHLPDNPEIRVEEEHPRKGELAELDMRRNLKKQLYPYNPDVITQAEVIEACEKLYAILNMPLDEDLLRHIEDPRCPGGRLRVYS